MLGLLAADRQGGRARCQWCQPSTMSADPIPVPKVSSMTTPVTSLPPRNRSLGQTGGVGVVECGDPCGRRDVC